MSQTTYEELADYRRSVARIYAGLRESSLDEESSWRQFWGERQRLLATHPQSALSAEQQRVFTGLPIFPYNPQLRFLLPVETAAGERVWELDLPEEGSLRLQRFGQVHFQVQGQLVRLSLFWLLGYGGGIFLPFRDLTNREQTYGGGRYLLDTIKQADLGQVDGRLVIDFNYAYNPSCAYHPRWVCPLAPPENWLNVAVQAGELRYPGQQD